MPQTLKKTASELERRIEERAERLKGVLKEYREAIRANRPTGSRVMGTRDRARLAKKQLDIQRANAEYIQLQKELDRLLRRIRT